MAATEAASSSSSSSSCAQPSEQQPPPTPTATARPASSSPLPRRPPPRRCSGGGRGGWRRPRSAPRTSLGQRRVAAAGGCRLAAVVPRRPGFFPVVGGGGRPSQALSALLPLVVAATAVAALGNPATFSWVSKEYYAPALGGIMLSIGIKLSIDDFALAFKRPVPLTIGYMAQYIVKPLMGVLIARAFGMPSAFFAGFVLTCCVSGAQLSSYASFLSKGDVALSILLTSCSTISSVVVTPVLTGLLIGSVVPVDGIAMAKSILQVVLVPVTLGLLLNTYAKAVVNVIQPVMPFVAMLCTSLCIGSPLAINRSKILSSEGFLLLLPIVTFHIAAFIVGYWISKLPMLRQEEPVCRTISVCTGMQSSTLAGLLATQFLGSSQAVPAACSVVIMAIFGLTLASYWGNGLRIRDIGSRFVPQASAGVSS
ncbi:hypothetical protein OsI_07191 [Oryza sativa Indica Group]|uniref:Sodium/metabolite cotransporter BASS3, chloroplastic n=1 Tax=Oryza sativa subsp. indica TaxID=39946 RepID=B8AHZ3_ORYSI|nr:hypothetical protein OsI_07191 [Oryza sativa Indica Group]